MAKFLLAGCIAVVAALAVTIARQTPSDMPIKTYGYGAQTCQAYINITNREALADAAVAAQYAFDGWMLGYVSAMSEFLVFRETTPDDMSAWLRRHCRTHPADNVAEAIVSLILDLSPSKQLTRRSTTFPFWRQTP